MQGWQSIGVYLVKWVSSGLGAVGRVPHWEHFRYIIETVDIQLLNYI
jgi:hypothetical protein